MSDFVVVPRPDSRLGIRRRLLALAAVGYARRLARKKPDALERRLRRISRAARPARVEEAKRLGARVHGGEEFAERLRVDESLFLEKRPLRELSHHGSAIASEPRIRFGAVVSLGSAGEELMGEILRNGCLKHGFEHSVRHTILQSGPEGEVHDRVVQVGGVKGDAMPFGHL